MKMSESNITRIRIFGLAVVVALAAYLSASINSLENGLIHITLLASLVAVGLATNLWGGVAASAVAAFAIILLNQFLGIFSRQFVVMNIASELFFYVIAGPLAGSLSGAVGKMQSQIDHWVKASENQTTHDDNFGALKFEWAMIRLEEEILRAKIYLRPLSIGLLQFDLNKDSTHSDRIAGLRAVIRIMRSSTQPPVVISYIGNDQILLILPEHSAEQAQNVLTNLLARTTTEKYFPKETSEKLLGKPLSQMGQLLMSAVTMSDESPNGKLLLEKARLALAG